MESNNAAWSLGFNHSKQDELSSLLLVDDESEREILPEDVLLRISRSHATLVSEAGEDGSDDASRSLRALLEALICTAKSALLSAPHRASACNALCGFLEYGIASSNLELRTLCFSASIWTRTFDVFIERSEGAKSKPMRQVLVTLVKVLCRNPDPNAVRFIRDAAVTKLLVIILGKECISFVKPALHALEHFISKQVIDMPDFLPRIIQFHPARNTSKGTLSAAAPISRFGECASPPYVSRSMNADPPQLSHFTNAIQCFLWSMLDCVRINTDLAPVTGRLLSSFLFSLQRTVMDDNQDGNSQDGNSLDVFVRPVYSFIKQHPDLIELSVHHLLPGLLNLDSSISTEFLKILPLDDFERGFTSHLDVIDIQIFLMASKAREGFGLVPYNYADNLTATMSGFSTPYGASIELLLLHVSPSIRLAALNFATSSKSTTALITENVLSSIRECLPQFHAEADAKSRNEFISIMKKLLTRLKGGLAQMSRSRNLSQSVLSAEASRTSIKPLKEASDAKDPSHALINCNVRFLKWYIMFLSGELFPTASYPRHITALKLLQLYLRLGLHTYMSMQYLSEETNGQFTREINRDCSNDRIVRLLFDLLVDPFDDVRSMAVLILKLGVLDSGSPCQDSKSSVPPSQFIDGDLIQPTADAQFSLIEVLRRAQDMMLRTGRADHADGAGRIHDLLYLRTNDLDIPNDVWKSRLDTVENVLSDLKAGIRIAKENLRMAVIKAPLHGHLIALRYIVSQPYFFKSLTGSGDIRYDRWRKIHDEISLCCTEVWQAVKGVLCVDSPEGHMGDEIEEDDLDIGVKDALSFSWRSLKESSALQHAIIANETYGPPDTALGLHYHDLLVIGGLAFTQLAELRHRGAFSTVSQTFAACCTRCIKSNDSKVTGLPEEWYQDTLSCIHEKASALTRRSAGIPAMITGILVAHRSSCFLENVMLDMQAISDTPVKAVPHAEVIQLPQVHAMNCLKDIFTNTQLGPRTEPYIADTLHIAAGCLESDVWAIQNCGLMLLKALINRLLGKNEANSSTKSTSSPDITDLLYDKFPNLPDLIVKLLQPYNQFMKSAIEPTLAKGLTMDIPQAQKVFPALEIIQRAGMPPKYRLTIKSLLLWHLGSTIWYIRKKSAKTISIVTDASSFYDEVTELLQEPWSTQNSLHGRLLCVRDLLFKASDTIEVIPSSIIQSLLRLFKPVAIQNWCPFTITAYMDVVADLLRSQRLGTKVDPDDKRRLLDIESELWYKNATYGQLDGGHGNLLDRSISRYDILAAQHRLDTVGSVDGVNLAAIPNLVRQLAKSDPDILYRLVTDFEDVIYQWRGQDIEAFQIGTSILLSIVSEVPMEDVKAVAMSKLGNLLSLHSSTHGSADYTSVPQFFAMLESFSDWNRASVHSSPEVADGAIRLQGAVISMLTQTKVNSFTDMYGGLRCAISPLEAWTRTVGLAGNECNEPHIRIAAAASLEGFQTALRQSGDRADTRPEFLGIYLVLYDTLNDDDTEIREKGASIVSWILLKPEPSGTAGSATSSLSPLAAKSRLTDFLIAHYNNSTALCYEAIGRLAGIRVELGRSVLSRGMANTTSAGAGHSKMGMRPMLLPSIGVSLGEARREDTALFSEEKQNLYIDDVQEACGWAIVITKLSSSSIESDSAHELEVWVMQGLAVLTEMAQAEVDGPLGWTTKPDVFTMGARIIYAARVLLHWASIGVAGVLEEDIREALQALHSVGEKNCLHGSWMQRIEDPLQRE